MSLFLLSVIFLTIVFMAVMIISLTDRVASIERLSRRMLTDGPPVDASDARFANLSGKRLWETMNGTQSAGMSGAALEALRPAYAQVLQRHIAELYEEGHLDGQQGMRIQPPPSRTIKTPEGVVESWLPAGTARTLYDIGLERATADEGGLPRLRERLDENTRQLFESAGLAPAPRLSDVLIPGAAPADASPGAPAAPVEDARTAAAPPSP